MSETLIQPSVGLVRLEKRLLRFVVRRENLDSLNPILDLSKPTIICWQLNNLLVTHEELGNQQGRGVAYTEKLKFMPRARESSQMRLFLDANNTMQFNRFLHRLFEELLHEHVANYIMFQPKKSAMAGVESFLKIHNLTFDDYPDVDFENDSLVKADYRLRKSRNLIGFDTFPLQTT